jgi:Flp pilus assembly protein TadD
MLDPMSSVARILASGPARVTLGVGLLAAAVYANSVVNDFVFDDRLLIENNRVVQGQGNAGELLLAPYHHGVELASTALYRPLTLASFALEYRAFGLDPRGYHLINVLLQVAVSLMVLRLGSRIGLSRFGAAAGAALFAVHPVHTEVVANLAGRAELVAALFALIALVAYIDRAESVEGRPVAAWVAGGSLLLALLAKESAITLLGVVVAWELTLGRLSASSEGASARRRGSGVVVFVPAVAVWFVLRAVALGGPFVGPEVSYVDNPLVDSTLAERWATAAVVAVRYLGLLVWPLRLSPDYSFAQILPVEPSSATALGAVVLLVGVLGAAAVVSRGSPRVAFLASFAVITFLPVSNIPFVIGTIMGERLLYLPSVAFCLLLGLGLSRVRDRIGARATWIALSVVVALASARTVARNRDWRDDLTLFSAAVKTSPQSVKVRSNLGAELMRLGRYPAAREELERALQIDPDYHPARVNLAQCLLDEGDLAGAEREARRALASMPGDPVAAFQLGEILLRDGRMEEAEAVFRELLAVRPGSGELHGRLGVVLEARGRTAEAEAELVRAVELEPSSATLHNDLGLFYGRLGRHDDAVEHLRRAVDLSPETEVLRNNLGNSLREAGHLVESFEELERAVHGRPGFAAAHYNLGLTLERLGRGDEAADRYRAAIRLRPRYGDALRALGRVTLDASDAAGSLPPLDAAIEIDDADTEAHALRARAMLRLGRYREAESDLLRVLQLNPRSVEARNSLGILHALRGDDEGARRWWEEALAIAPDAAQVRENLRKLERP